MGFWEWFKNSQRPRARSSAPRSSAPKTPKVRSLETYLSATYPELVRVLGAPNPGYSDNYKTTTAWDLLDGRVQIYDYKATNLYDQDLPSVAKLRSRRYNWHISTDHSAEANAEVARVRAALRQARGR